MKILIAGLGSIGRRHLRNLLALGEMDIILLRSHQSTIPDEDLTRFITETDLNEALSHEPDAVIVANPTALHLDVAIPAARQGCHIFLEKPLSDSMAKVSQFEEAVKSGGSKVQIGFQFRFHPGLLHVRRLIRKEAIGRILSVRAQWGEYLPNWHPWEDYRNSYSAQDKMGGGVILTLCHPLDYLRWLVGEVESLWSYSGKLGDLELDVEDTAEIGMRFENSVIGSLHLSYNQKPTTHCLELVGTEGTIRWEYTTGISSFYDTKVGEWQETPLPDGFERNDLFISEMRHFIAVINEDIEPACTLNDGVKALELALAAKKSSATGALVHL